MEVEGISSIRALAVEVYTGPYQLQTSTSPVPREHPAFHLVGSTAVLAT